MFFFIFTHIGLLKFFSYWRIFIYDIVETMAINMKDLTRSTSTINIMRENNESLVEVIIKLPSLLNVIRRIDLEKDTLSISSSSSQCLFSFKDHQQMNKDIRKQFAQGKKNTCWKIEKRGTSDTYVLTHNQCIKFNFLTIEQMIEFVCLLEHLPTRMFMPK